MQQSTGCRCHHAKIHLAKIVTMLSDDELVRRCLKGEPPAQKELYDRFAPRMLGVCFRYTRNRHEAEDVMQDGFIRAFHRMKQYRGDGSLEGWLRRIMVTTALNFLKRERRFREESDVAAHPGMEDDAAAALDQMENQEVMEMIQNLSPGYRAVLNLFAIEGYSHKEIGEMLGIGESTSRSQYVRARQILAQKIIQRNQIGMHHESKGITERI